MKLFSVTVSWRNKGERKDWLKTAVIMAETREEALEKFEANVSYPKDKVKLSSWANVSEWSDGVYTLSTRRGC